MKSVQPSSVYIVNIMSTIAIVVINAVEIAAVQASLLLRCGDIEVNPGPLEKEDLEKVDSIYILTENDFKDIYQEIAGIKSNYYQFGITLGLPVGELDSIRRAFYQVIDQAFTEVLLLWLRQQYDIQRHGSPTWLRLVEAVDSHNSALAKNIASRHHKPSTTDSVNHPHGESLSQQPVPDHNTSLSPQRLSGYQKFGAVTPPTATISRAEITPSPFKNSTGATSRHNTSLSSVFSMSASLENCRGILGAFYNRKIDDYAWPIVDKEINFINITLLRDKTTWRRPVQGSLDDIICDDERISCCNLFDDVATLQKRFILIEGRPGSGKTALIIKISRDWANGDIPQLESFLIIFVPLRKLSMEHDRGLDTILRVACPSLTLEDHNALKMHIEKYQGENVIFAFDGFDEYKPRFYKRKVENRQHEKKVARKAKEEVEDVHYILYGRTFPKALIILTSRPAACTSFHPYAGRRIEAVGFLNKQVIEFMNSYFGRRNAENLIDHLKAYPNLMNMCYLPVHSVMLALIYEQYIDSEALTAVSGVCPPHLPKTDTEVYKYFTLAIIRRSLKRRSTTKHQNVKLNSFDELSRENKNLFDKICKLAFKAMIESRQVFASSAAKYNISKTDSLGLIVTDQRSDIMPYDSDKTYAFLHLTLQEYLAALYIARKREPKQIEFIKLHNNLHAVWRFLCGMMDFSRPTSKNIFEVLIGTTEAILTHLYYAHEASHSWPSCYVIHSQCYHLEFRGTFLSISDLRTIGAVMNKSHIKSDNSKPVELELEGCTFNVEAAISFLQAIHDCPFSLELRRGEGVISFLMGCKKYLEVNSIGSEHAATTCTLSRNQSHLKRVYMKQLNLSDNNIGQEKLTNLVADCLKLCSQLQDLDLDENNIDDTEGHILSEGLKYCKDLKDLHLRGNGLGSYGIKALMDGLKCCTQLRTLFLEDNYLTDNTVSYLVEIIKFSHCLQRLGLRGNKFTHDGNKMLEEATRERNSGESATKLVIYTGHQ